MIENGYEYVKKGRYFSLIFRTGDGFYVTNRDGKTIISTVFEDTFVPCAPGFYCGRDYEEAKMMFNAMEDMVSALNTSIANDKEEISKLEGRIENIRKSYEKEHRLNEYENDNRTKTWKDWISSLQKDIKESESFIEKIETSSNITIKDLAIMIAGSVSDDYLQKISILVGKAFFESLDRRVIAED